MGAICCHVSSRMLNSFEMCNSDLEPYLMDRLPGMNIQKAQKLIDRIVRYRGKKYYLDIHDLDNHDDDLVYQSATFDRTRIITFIRNQTITKVRIC